MGRVPQSGPTHNKRLPSPLKPQLAQGEQGTGRRDHRAQYLEVVSNTFLK